MTDQGLPRAYGAVTSVNVGRPRMVRWAGRDVLTGIWKAPVEGRIPLRGVNFAGDGQADLRVHGGQDKAVYAYAAEDYAWWGEVLGSEVAPGTFGENLTTAGIDLDGAVVGEVWGLGRARLRVTQPRMPCFKLGIRMGDAGFVERFDDARRYGAYLRIVEEGEIGAGDAVALVSRPAHGLTVGRIAAIQAAPETEGLHRLRDVPDVPEVWKGWAERQLLRRS